MRRTGTDVAARVPRPAPRRRLGGAPRRQRDRVTAVRLRRPTLTAEQSDAISLPFDEPEQWAWCDDRQLRERLPVRMLRRITAAQRARTDGSTGYLETGSISS